MSKSQETPVAGKAIFINCPVAQPIISFKKGKYIRLMIGCATGKMIEMVFSANLASPKSQNMIVPSKLVNPSSQIQNLARGQFF